MGIDILKPYQIRSTYGTYVTLIHVVELIYDTFKLSLRIEITNRKISPKRTFARTLGDHCILLIFVVRAVHSRLQQTSSPRTRSFPRSINCFPLLLNYGLRFFLRREIMTISLKVVLLNCQKSNVTLIQHISNYQTIGMTLA